VSLRSRRTVALFPTTTVEKAVANENERCTATRHIGGQERIPRCVPTDDVGAAR